MRESQRHPSMIVGVSDGGAHLIATTAPTGRATSCASGCSTAGSGPIEEGVRQMTQVPAALCGFADRGMVLPGYAADLFLFDPTPSGRARRSR